MSGLQAIADRVEIEALRGEFTDAAMMRLGQARAASRLRIPLPLPRLGDAFARRGP